MDLVTVASVARRCEALQCDAQNAPKALQTSQQPYKGCDVATGAMGRFRYPRRRMNLRRSRTLWGAA